MASKHPPAAGQVRDLLRAIVVEPARFADWSASRQDLGLRVARRVRLLGRLAAGLRNADRFDSLPATARDQLVGAEASAAARERLARWELDRIAWALEEQPDLPLVAMKGAAYLLLGLPNAVGRVFADVDLMTAEERLEELEGHLNARGWPTRALSPYDQHYYRQWTHELPPLVHREREMEIDLHHNVLPRTARLKPSGARILAASRTLPGSRYRVPSDEDLVLHAMTHLMFGDELADKLRDLVDIRDLVLHFATQRDDFWASLLARAEVLDLRRPASYSLRYAAMLLDLELPAAARQRIDSWAPPRPIQRLMDHLVPRALFPVHPDATGDRRAAAARWLLYLRSHWIRMPPWLLAWHLANKALRTRFRRRRPAAAHTAG